MAADPIVQVHDLTHAHGDRPVLRGVDLTLSPGEVLGVLGPNGAGKTTLIEILCGLLRPDGGAVAVAGHDLRQSPGAARRMVGLVPQELALYPDLSGRDNLRFFGRLHGLSGDALRSRVQGALEQADLTARADDRVSHYSGGMKRRLNLAAGALHGPALLLLDEPTVGVDPQSRRRLLDGIARAASEGAAVVLATHLMQEAEEVCHEVVILDEGRVLAAGAPAELVRQLEGGVIHLELDRPAGDDLAAAVEQLDGVSGARVLEQQDGEGQALAVQTAGAEEVLPRLLQLVAARGRKVRSLEVLRQDLEGVFLHLTGRRPRD